MSSSHWETSFSTITAYITSLKFPNAALRGEQRYTTQLKPLCHKHKSQTLNQNCQALRIPLERLVMRALPAYF
ncbi:hypothetical protein CGJ24_23220 [Vibrio parahaemolyticus]|nr:hypothetical protein CGJ24_23220 [Vibrio parahaemolyticus]